VAERIRIEDFIPIDDRVIVRPYKTDDKTKGGVYLPPAALAEKREIVQSGEIVAIGSGRFTNQGECEAMMDLRVGDVVYFARFQGWLFTIGEGEEQVEYRVFGQHDLFGRRRRESE